MIPEIAAAIAHATEANARNVKASAAELAIFHRLCGLTSRHGYWLAPSEPRRRRTRPWVKRARFANTIPDVVNTQQAGHHGSLCPSARRGPECRPVCSTAETLWRAAAASWKGAFAPRTYRRSVHEKRSRKAEGSEPVGAP